MKRYFAYIRVSTPKQGQGVSLQEQKAAIERHAARHGLSITEWFEEKETAVKEGRGVFSRMLTRLGKREAEGVIIHKIDRSARNLWDWANLAKLVDRGIDVQFAHDSVDLQSRGGRLSADIMAVVAADYVRNLKDEVRKGFYGRLKQGVYPLPAPLGYLDRGAGRPKEHDPMAGPLVRQAFERYATGSISLNDLADEVHRWGLRPRRGIRMSDASLSDMFRNPFYIGLIRIQKTNEFFQGAHAPLVTKALFDRVQAVLAGKARAKVIAHEFLFRRFIRCGACGLHLVGERKKGRYVYYRCYSRTCRGVVTREEPVEELIRKMLNLTELLPGEVRDIRDMAEQELNGAATEIESQRQSLRFRLVKCEERLARITDAFVDQLLDKEAYETRKTTLLREKREILDILENPDSLRSGAQTVLGYLELPNIQRSGYELAQLNEKRAIADSITWNLRVDGKEPAIMLKSPFQEIVNWRISQIGGPSRGRLGTRTRKLFEILKTCAERQAPHSTAQVRQAA